MVIVANGGVKVTVASMQSIAFNVFSTLVRQPSQVIPVTL